MDKKKLNISLLLNFTIELEKKMTFYEIIIFSY